MSFNAICENIVLEKKNSELIVQYKHILARVNVVYCLSSIQ